MDNEQSSDDRMTVGDIRTTITRLLTGLRQEIQTSGPPIVQELTLAQRHLEDARMRLGVAQAYEKGLDPWANKVEPKQ